MPRRTRTQVHTYRKHPTPPRQRASVEEEERRTADTGEDEPAASLSSAAPTYVRREPVAPTSGYVARLASASQPSPSRAPRVLTTDYGYVVSEMKRIGITFGGLIVLLIVISRLLH